MKHRIGVITQNREDGLKIREGFQDVLAVPAKNVLDLYQVNGNQPMHAIVFVDQGELAKEFKSYHSFIRSKHGYTNVPMLIIAKDDNFRLGGVVVDPLVRVYSAKEGLFLPLLNFMPVVTKSEAAAEIISQAKIEQEFVQALNERLGQSSNFKYRPANDDESHASFFAAMSGEISSNLVWMKFSARILDEGSVGLKETFKSFTEAEVEETTTKILQMVLDQFQQKLIQSLKERGALMLPSSEHVSAQDRVLLIKQSQAIFLVFESPTCSVLLEEIRYI